MRQARQNWDSGRRVDGDVIECGVWRGGSMQAIARVKGEEYRAANFRTFDTICSATQERQDAVVELLEEPLDAMIVIGGYNSSNTCHLADLCRTRGGAAAAAGMELEDGKAEVDDVAVVAGNPHFVGIEIHIGRNRIVRRIFEHLGYDVVSLDRVQYAGLTKKDLPRGKWRYLNEKEVIRLKYFL